MRKQLSLFRKTQANGKSPASVISIRSSDASLNRFLCDSLRIKMCQSLHRQLLWCRKESFREVRVKGCHTWTNLLRVARPGWSSKSSASSETSPLPDHWGIPLCSQNSFFSYFIPYQCKAIQGDWVTLQIKIPAVPWQPTVLYFFTSNHSRTVFTVCCL